MKSCLHCKKIFTPKREAGKFCSDKCRVTWNRVHGKAKKDDSKLDLLIKAVSELRNKIEYAPITQASFDGKLAGIYIADEMGQWADPEPEKPKTYHELLGNAMTAKSIGDCSRLVAEALKLNLPAWQFKNIEQAAKERSRHPDLN